MDKKGAVISCVSGVVALGGLTAVFMRNASPYVTIAEAKTSSGDGLHVAGQIVANSIATDLSQHEIKFVLQDANGQTMPVIYTGAPISNLGTATRVVAIGRMSGNGFKSDELLVKCPSKYESQTTPK